MKRFLYLLILIFLLASSSCKKDEQIIPIRPNSIILKELSVEKNRITLNWSSVPEIFFKEYIVYKYYSYGEEQQLSEIWNANDTMLIDTTIQDVSYIGYRVYALLDSGYTLTSNKQILDRPYIFDYNIEPFYVEFNDKVDRAFYLDYTKKNLLALNYKTNKLISEVNGDVEYNYFCSGDNGYGPEVYVPNKNGVISIYDGLTLEKKEDFTFTNDPEAYDNCIYSVTTDNNGHIYFSCKRNKIINVLNRSTLTVVQSYHNIYQVNALRLKYINNKIYGVEMGVTPSDAVIFFLSDDGLIDNSIYTTNGYDYNFGPYRFDISPKENFLISGSVYKINGNYFIKQGVTLFIRC